MDTLTQIALGTAIAEAFFRRSLGRRSLLFGAFCGWFPDIDVFFHQPLSWDGLANHRGVTHSLLCLPLLAPVIGEIGYRFRKKGTRLNWIHLAFWALITHPLLDVCTTYGTQLLAPFSTQRFSTNAISIIDLLYSMPLFVAVFLAIRKGNRERARNLAQISLGLSTIYLGFCHGISYVAYVRAQDIFEKQGFTATTIGINAPIFLPLLRRAVARNQQGDIIVTWISIVSSKELPIAEHRRTSTPLIDAVLNDQEAKIFRWFADEFVIVEQVDSQITMTDARYGLFLNPWWSPFSAYAKIGKQNDVGPLKRAPRPKGTNYQAELQVGWQLMWGNHSQGTESM